MSEGESGHEEYSHAEPSDATPVPLPWSIKLMGVAFALYLLMRGVQGVRWLIRWATGG